MRIEVATQDGLPVFPYDAARPLWEQVVVGVVDSGVDSTHVDLNYVGGATWTVPNPQHPNDTSDPGVDHYGHGTHVAGIVGGLNNGIGIVGVAPNAPVFSLKVLDGNGKGSLGAMLSAIQYAAGPDGARVGLRVINLSLSAFIDPTSADYPAIFDYVCNVVKQASDAGVVVSVAAGNYGVSTSGYLPASCPEAVVVFATDDDASAPASYTNFLAQPVSEVDKARACTAPGTSVVSTMSREVDILGYRTLSGTSMAAPHFAGTAALCIATGTCSNSTTGIGKGRFVVAQAKEVRYPLPPSFGFDCDAERPCSDGRFFGYLLWAGEY